MFWIANVANIDIVQMGALGVLIVAICAYFWYLAHRPAGNSNATDKSLQNAAQKLEKVCKALDMMVEKQNAVHEDLQGVCRKLDDLVKDQAELVGWLKGRFGGQAIDK